MFSLALEVSFRGGGGALRRWEGAPPPAGGLYLAPVRIRAFSPSGSHPQAFAGACPAQGDPVAWDGQRMILSAGPSPTLRSLTRAHRGARNPRAGTGDEGLESSWQFLAAL